MNIEIISNGDYSPVKKVRKNNNKMQGGNAQGQSAHTFSDKDVVSREELKDEMYEQVQEIDDFDGSVANEQVGFRANPFNDQRKTTSVPLKKNANKLVS